MKNFTINTIIIIIVSTAALMGLNIKKTEVRTVTQTESVSTDSLVTGVEDIRKHRDNIFEQVDRIEGLEQELKMLKRL